jgi:hypothetical protein
VRQLAAAFIAEARFGKQSADKPAQSTAFLLRELPCERAIKIKPNKGIPMAKPNYTFEKRQKELAKKRKKEEKRQWKEGSPGDLPADATTQLPAG